VKKQALHLFHIYQFVNQNANKDLALLLPFCDIKRRVCF